MEYIISILILFIYTDVQRNSFQFTLVYLPSYWISAVTLACYHNCLCAELELKLQSDILQCNIVQNTLFCKGENVCSFVTVRDFCLNICTFVFLS